MGNPMIPAALAFAFLGSFGGHIYNSRLAINQQDTESHTRRGRALASAAEGASLA